MDNVPRDAAIAGLCAGHTTTRAVGTCARCGNFMCARCASANGLCPSCCGPNLGTFPLMRSAGMREVLAFAVKSLSADAGVFFFVGLLGYAALGLLFMSVQQLAERRAVDVAAMIALSVLPIASVALFAGRLAVALETARGSMPSAPRFYLGVRQTPRVLAVMAPLLLLLGALAAAAVLIAAMIVGAAGPSLNDRAGLVLAAVGTVLVAPAAYLVAPLSLALVPAADGVDITEALRLGFAAADGRRWRVLGVLLVAAALMIPAAFTFCIGVPFGLTFVDLSLTTAYLAYAPRGSVSATRASGSA